MHPAGYVFNRGSHGDACGDHWSGSSRHELVPPHVDSALIAYIRRPEHSTGARDAGVLRYWHEDP